MFSTALFCFLIHFFPWVSFGLVVLQSEVFLMPSPGDTVTLHCSLSAGSSMSSYTMYWYRQAHSGATIEFLKKEHETSSETERFSVSLDTSGNSFSLRALNLTVEDSATYYCAASTVLQDT